MSTEANNVCLPPCSFIFGMLSCLLIIYGAAAHRESLYVAAELFVVARGDFAINLLFLANELHHHLHVHLAGCLTDVEIMLG